MIRSCCWLSPRLKMCRLESKYTWFNKFSCNMEILRKKKVDDFLKTSAFNIMDVYDSGGEGVLKFRDH